MNYLYTFLLLSCATAEYTVRVVHSDTAKPLSGISLHLMEATGDSSINGWPTMEQIDRGIQTTNHSGECTFKVKCPGYCSVYPVPFMDFDYSDKPSDYFEKETGVYVIFIRPYQRNNQGENVSGGNGGQHP